MQTINLIGKLSIGGSIPPVIEPKSIFANGTYEAPSGVDGYNPIVVDVPEKIEKTLHVTANGTYTPEEGQVYNGVVVNVPAYQPTLTSLTINSNGIYTPPSGVDGFNEVIVSIPDFVHVANQDGTVELKVLPSGESYVYFNNFVLQYGISGLEILNLPILETILSNFRRDEAWTAQNYTHIGIQTDGHIGIYDNSLRGWTEDYSSYSPATFNAVLHLTVASGNQNIQYNPIH